MSSIEVDNNNTFEWKIDYDNGNVKWSGEFAIDGNHFFLSAGHRLYSTHTNDVCHFRLYPTKSPWFLPFSYTFSIIDRKGKDYVILKGNILKMEERLLMILDYDDLRKRNVIKIDSLTVRFTTTRGTTDGGDGLLETLSNDFSTFYENETNTDCVLKVSDDQFNVHRAILSARSSVFSAMFHHDTAENRSGEVNISDLKATVLSDVLYYVYSGKIRALTADTAMSLYTAADKYDLPKLRTECLEFLKRNLTIDNFCEVAILAHIHDELELEERVMWFIEEKLDEVLESSQWQQFSEDQTLLANKLLACGFKAAKKKLTPGATSN